MSKKSNWFVVATEGATTDGRKISGECLTQIAKNYDPKKYGARINLEHIKFRMLWKDEPHSLCYGDVLAVKTEEKPTACSRLLCEDCDEPIPEARRQAITGCTRCRDCQEIYELQQKGYRK